jgi:hypothetical protein
MEGTRGRKKSHPFHGQDTKEREEEGTGVTLSLLRYTVMI